MKNKIISMFIVCALIFALTLNIAAKQVFALSESDDYSAKAYFLMDYNTKQVLSSKNENAKIPVASIVKLMTIYLTCNEIENGKLKLEDKVVASEKASSMGGSQVFIEEGTEYSIEDLLKSSIVSSANDASVLLAETICGSEENFVKLMNKTAQQLNMTGTNYVNCTGLPASGQFSCAKDTAILLREVIKFDTYHKFSTIWIDKLTHSKGRETELVNTNKLIRYFEGCDGGKTGSTNEAGYCLSATAKRGNMRLIAVVLGAENGKQRFAETSKLLNYGFANFENKLVVSGDYFSNKLLNVNCGKTPSLKVVPEKEVYVLTNKHGEDNIDIKEEIKQDVNAPIKKGDRVGKVIILKNNQVMEEISILADESIEKLDYLDNISKIVNNWKIA